MFIGRFFLAGIVAAAISAGLVVMTGAGGHGTYYVAKILFPLTMALTRFTAAITTPLIALALIQYPAYGLYLDWARSAGRLQANFVILLCVHVVFVALAFLWSHPTFTP